MHRLCLGIFLSILWLLPGSAFAVETGDNLPPLVARAMDGQNVDIAALAGKKPVLIVFWASWCPSCKSEVPKLNRLEAQFGSKGMSFIGVNIGANDSPERARAFMEKTALRYPVVFDQDSSITRRYRVLGVPTIILADRSGRVVFQGHQVPEQFAQTLAKLIKH